MINTLKYYFHYFRKVISLGFISFFTHRNKFKNFSSFVNDFDVNFSLQIAASKIPTVSLDSLMQNKVIEVKFRNYVWKQGNVTFYELYCISALCCFHNPETIFEIGTFDGKTSLHMAINSPDSTKIHTLDLPPENISETRYNLDPGDPQLISKNNFRIGEFFITQPESNKIVQHYGDSARFDFGSFKKKIDLFFIDGAHSYDYIKTDTENAFDCISSNGIILWHDYGNVSDVTRYLNELKEKLNLFRIKETSLVIYKNEL